MNVFTGASIQPVTTPKLPDTTFFFENVIRLIHTSGSSRRKGSVEDFRRWRLRKAVLPHRYPVKGMVGWEDHMGKVGVCLLHMKPLCLPIDIRP